MALVEGCRRRGPGPSTHRSAATTGRPSASSSGDAGRARRSRTSRSGSALSRDSLLDLRLETGRTHQIRAHLLAIGHPVAGDPQYGGAGRYGLERQFLHSRRLAFEHPFTGEQLELESALPADLEAALELARVP